MRYKGYYRTERYYTQDGITNLAIVGIRFTYQHPGNEETLNGASIFDEQEEEVHFVRWAFTRTIDELINQII